jgi:hypothetical protein
VKHLLQIFLKYIFSCFFKNKYRVKQFLELFVANGGWGLNNRLKRRFAQPPTKLTN